MCDLCWYRCAQVHYRHQSESRMQVSHRDMFFHTVQKLPIYKTGHTQLKFCLAKCHNRSSYYLWSTTPWRRSGGMEVLLQPLFDLGTRWRRVVRFTPRQLYPQGQNPWYPLDRRMGGSQSRAGPGGEEKNSQPLPGLEPSNIQPVAQRYTTRSSRLRCYLW
jgi:hypothetical protein